MELEGGSRLRRGGKKSRSTNTNTQTLYDFSLRCAIRAFLEQTGPQSSLAKEQKKEKSDRHSIHIGVTGVLGSITDKFSDEGRPDKLTREIVHGLLRRLDDVKKTKEMTRMTSEDKAYVSAVSQFRKSLQAQRFRPSGTVNDLIITFLQLSKTELAKIDPTSVNDQLNKHMAQFAELVIRTVQEDAPASATPELMEMLNGVATPAKASRPSSRRQVSSASGSSTPGPPDSSLEALEKFPMVQTVQNLFQKGDLEHHRKLQELQAICTEPMLLVDFKKCINNIHMNQPFPGRREDFPTQQAYENWQRREIKQLTELMNTLMLMKPDLALNSANQSDRADSAQSTFVFVPNDPRSLFRLLMKMCIDFDLEVVPDSERAKTSVLSVQSDDLLRECWRTWRISAPFRAVTYLQLVASKFQQDKLDLEDVQDAMRALDKVIKETDVSNWAINDRESLIRTYEDLNQILLYALENALSEYWTISPDWVNDLVGMLDKIYENPAYLEDHADPMTEFLRLEDTVQGAAVMRWRVLEKVMNNTEKDNLSNLLTLADKLIKELVNLTKGKFKTPLKGVLPIPGIVMERYMPLFALEMENWAHSMEAKQAPVEVTFELYHKVLSLKRLYDQFGPKKKAALFKVESWFLPHVRRWLKTTNEQTPEWVENAIKQDEFKAISETAVHSSSIVDLFSMFHQAVDFVQNLQWPNELQRCKFLTVLSKVIAIALEHYTNTLDYLIKDTIYPPNEYDPETSSSAASFLDKARLTLGHSSSKDEEPPPDFTPEMCVMLNDIEAARGRLDRLYQTMDVDEIAERMERLREASPSSTTVEKTEQTNFLYSIKVVRAENLQPLDSNGLSDPFVVLTINKKEIGKTRTLYRTLNPRWDQTFDVWLNERSAEVLAVVYDEDMIGANQECGSVWFKLQPEYFDDYQMHDINLKLDPQGTLLLRVSLVGEKDDIQFWFVKSFRTLKGAENDAAGLIVDQMGAFIRQCLSRKALDKLLRKERSFFSSFSRSSKQHEPSLQDCEDAIAPLLDYLETNLKILNDNLSETNMQLVVLKIWKEILNTLENLVRPAPSSESQQAEIPPLDEYEEHIVLKWLELLKVFFNGGEDGDAVPLDKLENTQYRSLIRTARHNRESVQKLEGH